MYLSLWTQINVQPIDRFSCVKCCLVDVHVFALSFVNQNSNCDEVKFFFFNQK